MPEIFQMKPFQDKKMGNVLGWILIVLGGVIFYYGPEIGRFVQDYFYPKK